MSPHLAYRHVQTYTTLWLIDLAVAVITVPTVLASGGPDTQLGLLIVLATVLGLPLILGRLVVELDATHLRWHFGYLGWPAWSQPLAEIAITEVARADVVYGSGIKGTPKNRQFNVTVRGPALRLHLHDGRKVTLGTPEPQRLQGFVDARREALIR
jgi:hypothetical protein